MSILAGLAVPHPPLILPEVGRGEERGIQATIDAYRRVSERVAALAPDTIILTTPHSVMYSDYFHISPGEKAAGDFGNFRAPTVKVAVEYDTEFVKSLADLCAAENLPAGTLGERSAALDHATMIPLRFLAEHKLSYKLVRIGLSGLPPQEHYRFGQLIKRTAERLSRRAVFIASGDLSHKLKADGPYGFAAEGPQFDGLAMKYLGAGDFLSLLQIDSEVASKAAECGLRSFWIMAGAFDRVAIKSEALSYEGPFGVGYGVVWFQPEGADDTRAIGEKFLAERRRALEARKANEDALVRLARYSLETYVKTRVPAPMPEDLPPELTGRQAGAFVSLKKDGELRGCIGTILPTKKSLAAEIMENAISAAVRDPRFPPVQAEELAELTYSVDVLGELEPISSPDELDVKRYGVIVEAGGRRGLLLPDLAGVDTVEQQIDIARRKGNIAPHETVKLWRFEVVRHL